VINLKKYFQHNFIYQSIKSVIFHWDKSSNTN